MELVVWTQCDFNFRLAEVVKMTTTSVCTKIIRNFENFNLYRSRQNGWRPYFFKNSLTILFL